MNSPVHLSELDALRSQVSLLSSELAERDRALREQSLHFDRERQDVREQSEMLRAIVEATAAETGEKFFAALVTRLTSVLKVEYAVIGEVQGDRIKKIHTLAVSTGGILVDNFEYELAHTPCAIAMSQTFTCFDQSVQATFPHFQRLADLGAESYCAVPLRTQGGAVIGLLVVMDTKPLTNSDYLQSLLGVFAPRVTAEFERRRADQELAQALAELNNVVDTIPDVMFTLDTQGNMVKWNRRVEEVTGYSSQELLNKSALAFVPPEEQICTAAAIRRAFTEGYAELEGHLRTKDFRTIPYHWTGAQLKNPHGEPIGITGIGRDVSDKKRAEKELWQQQRRLVDAQALAHLGSWDWDIDTGELEWSDEQFRIFGYEPRAIVVTYDIFLASLHPDDHGLVLAAINDALLGRRPCNVECRIVRPNGEVRSIHVRGEVHRDAIGHPLSLAGTVLDITERKRAEAALRESEERYRTLVDLSPNGVLVYSNGKKVYVNQTACTIMGAASPEQLLENPTFHVSHPDAYDSIHASLAQILATGEPVRRVERKYQRLDGTEISVEVDAGRIMWNGEPAVQVIFADITERKQAEEALHEREKALARFKATLDQTHDCVFMFAPDTLRFIYCNRGAVDQVGYTEAELFTMTPLDIKPEFTARSYRELLEPLRDGRKQSCIFETVHRHKDGHNVAVEVSLQLVQEQGQEGRFVAVVREITERKLAEEALRESEQRFDLAVRGSNTGIWDWDLRSNKTYFSPLWKSMLGYEEHELRGEFSEWERRLHPDDRERSSATVRAYLNGTTRQYELEHRLRHKDGSYRWILARGVSLLDAEGNPYRMAGSHIDITDQKQTQEALTQHERQLQTVLDALPVGVWFIDQSGTPLLANPAAKQIWSSIKQIGLQASNNQSGWWETMKAADEPHRWSLSRALTIGVSSLNEIFDLPCLDGTRKTLRNSTVPVQDEAGNILGAIVLNEDITTLRQAQEALKLTQFSVDRAVEGFFWIDPDARILNVNDAACTMLEYTREELTTMTLHDIDPTFPSERWSAHWKELKQKGSMTFESKYWSRTGRALDTEVTVNYLQYEGKEYNCAIMRDIGERKRADAALRQSEERFRQLIGEAPLGVTVLDERGHYVKVNRAFCNLVGYREDELLGQTYALFTHPDDLSHNLSLTAKATSGEQPGYRLEHRYIRKDGRTIWVTVNAMSLALPGSANHHLVAIIEDSTDRKRAEESLCQSEERFAKAFHSSPHPVGITEMETGRCVDVNDACLELFGFHREEVIGHTTLMLGIWPNSEDRARLIERLQSGGPVRNLEMNVRTSTGEIRHVLVSSDLVEMNGMRCLLTVGNDITERKRADEEIKKSHTFLRQVIDIDPNFIFAKDRDGRFNLVNKAVADVYGTTVDELMGKTDADFNANQEEVAFFRQKDLDVMDSLEDLFIPEEVITDSTGKTRWLQTVKRPILDDQGRGIMVLVASTDITDRKRMEEALRQGERDLQSALQERERISQDLHDGILQSLFAVGLTLEVSKSLMSPRVRKKSGSSLDQAIGQLNRVMREIRNFIAGLGTDLFQGKDLSTALQHMLDSLTEHQATHVRLLVEDRATQAVSAEQSLHLLLVIQEAVSNCIRHGRAQEARVSLKMLKHGVRLSIRDNGCGFNKDAAKGIGHGLGNMAARAQKIGGRFTILSKVNEGTRIVLDLPKEASDVPR